MSSELELYIHIPFCVKKCDYCDFLSGPVDPAAYIPYVRRVDAEMAYYGQFMRERHVTSVYIGGGTPTVLSGALIAELVKSAKAYFTVDTDAEITCECNPGTLDVEKARSMVAAGVNRISIGLQSAQDNELKILGRIHTFPDFLNAFDAARKAGCNNINVDIMSGLPWQKPDTWMKTLRQVLTYRPEHISAYSLSIEEGTKFHRMFAEDDEVRRRGGTPQILPTEEEEQQMLAMTEAVLGDRGYKRYEISNFARPGYECRHNLGYWERKNYLGLGLGASSLFDEERFKNTPNLERYMTHTFEHIHKQKLSRREQMEEFMFLGLRKVAGVSRDEFREKFDTSIEAKYGPVMRRLKANGLLVEDEGDIKLTTLGMSVSNIVLAEFLLDDESR